MVDRESKTVIIGTVKYQGRRLQEEFPYVRFFYRAGLSLPKIAKLLNENPYIQQSFNNVNDATMTTIVRYALCGNKRAGCGPVFDGLLSDEEYASLARQHEINAGIGGHKRNMANGKGALFGSHKSLVDAAKEAAKARGQVPWSYFEELDTWEMKDAGFRSPEIARVLNLEYHDDKEVRTSGKIRNFFQRNV